MSPAEVLLGLVRQGVVLSVEGGRLRYACPVGALSAEDRRRAGACRGALVALVRAGAVLPEDRAAWPEAAREDAEERAAIMTFDGGLAVADAERAAERLVRVAFTTEFLGRAAMIGDHAAAGAPRPDVVNPDAAAVATARPGRDPHRRP